MTQETWFEIYTSSEEEGTETVHSCDTIEEVNVYLLENKDEELFYDKWESTPSGNKRIEL
jgi:hypothetical protein